MEPITKQQAVFYFCEGCEKSPYIGPDGFYCEYKKEGEICDMLKDFLYSQIGQGNIKPPKYRWKLKSEKEIEKILKESEYESDSEGNYYHDIFPPFTNIMWEGCGKYILNNSESYHPDWVEKEEI